MPDVEERLVTMRRFMKRRLEAKTRTAAAAESSPPELDAPS